MSTVILQIGQCGNQVGQELWELLEQDQANHKGLVYCSHDGRFRSVNVDSEPKVIRSILHECEKNGGHSYRETNAIIGRYGRGSNWAFGYTGNERSKEHSLMDQAMDIIRKEIERCPSYSGIICMHSLAGGTGSGMGSRLIEALRDDYPMNYILSCAVAPHSQGENPLQHYNMLLSLAAMQRHCDGILWFENDWILQQLQQRFGQSQVDCAVGESMQANVKPVTLKQINKRIASTVAGLILPTDSVTGASAVSIGMEPWELVRSLCSLPSAKFVNANFVCRSKLSWQDLTTSLLRSSVSRSNEDSNASVFNSIANLLVARGEATPSFSAVLPTMDHRLKAAVHSVSWNPFPVDSWTSKLNPFRPANSLSLTWASNNNRIVPLLENTKFKARQKFEVGAYLHWYQRYNCDREDFELAFTELENIIASYKDAVL